MSNRSLRQLTVFLAVTIGLLGWNRLGVSAADAVTEAKRKAAMDMVRQNKPAEALSLFAEVTTIDATNYKDYLAIARMHEKLGHSGEAKTAYKKILELIPAAHDYDERVARTEAEKHVKVLGTTSAKVDEAVEAFMKKLDALQRDAVTANDDEAIDRLFRLQGAMIRAEKFPKLGYCELFINSGSGAECGLIAAVGDKFHVIAHGRWRYGAGPETECTAAGNKAQPFNNLPTGMLIAVIAGNGRYTVGEETVFTAQAAGPVMFGPNIPSMVPGKRSGSIQILVRRE